MELAELSKLVDEYDVARTVRLAADKQAKELKSVESRLKETILNVMFDQDVGFASGLKIRVKRQTKTKHKAEDWGLFYEYVVANDAMDLLQKRLSDKAIVLRQEDDIVIPGIVAFEVNDLSVAKL